METNPTIRDLRCFIEESIPSIVTRTKRNAIWRKPLLATAAADSRFNSLNRIAVKDHMMPRDLLSSAKTVIVFFIPFVQKLATENHKGKFPCRNWGLAYESTNGLINTLSKYIRDFLRKKGYNAESTPATHNFDEKELVAQWSHKHLGFLVGLGRFGVNAQLITPSGCAGRLGSLVTDAELGDNPLVKSKELCHYKTGNDCLRCIKRCPVQAVSLEGIDRRRCWDRLNFNIDHCKTLAGLKPSTHVCGKCQVLVPCSLEIPSEAAY